MRETDAAYAAGLVDGEGSVQINPGKGQGGKRYWGLTVQVASNNKDVLEWLRETFGMGSITSWKSKRSPQGKVSHNWRLHSQDTGKFLSLIYQHMRIKRGQAEIAIEFLKHKAKVGSRLTPEMSEQRNSLAKDMRIMNRTYGKGLCGPFPKGVL